MLREAIFSATCNATMTTVKHCKLRLTCYTQLQFVSQRCEKQHYAALQAAKMGC